jgi:iron(III) transport system permease protein
MSLANVRRDLRKHANGWLLVSLVGAAVILLPLLPILFSLFQTPNENWLHIQQYLLRSYVLQTFGLVLYTTVFTVILAVPLAWLVAAYDFPGRRFFRWALMLPLAVPPYIAAYTYSDMFSYTGIVQESLRAIGIMPNPKVFGILSMQGAVFVFTLFLFPYVYIVTKAFLERQSGSYVENAVLLGRSPVAIFTRVILPLSRPAIIGGVTLVIFEVLSDYGVANYYGLQTVSTAIFRTWFGMYDVDSAIRLAAWLMVGIIGLFILERILRQNMRFSASTSRSRPLLPRRLTGIHAAGALLFCGFIFAWSFLIPVLQLVVWAVWTHADVLTSAFWALTFRTLQLALLATAIIMAFAVVVANVCRSHANPFSQALSRMVTAGYSIPGAIVAIGVLVVFLWIDQQLAPLYQALGLGKAPLVLSLSLVMLVVAYVVRFMATGYNAVEAGFTKIGTRFLEVSRTLGHGMTRTFFKVDLHLIKGALFGGAILTFVEIIKELPLALLLRPFNFETLATKAYQYASDELIHQAAVPSLFIIGVSMISVFILHQLGKEADE